MSSNILDRIDRLTNSEIRAIFNDLNDCKSYERVMGGFTIDHMTQAEIRTLFARNEFPISKGEVYPACVEITRRARILKEHATN
ncbi:hypothetical protein IKE71_02685 [Candidatus Saccharibacteria bacterium]|nr:hypothetical protein [Candidatus Saccharibacteria bacterium]